MIRWLKLKSELKRSAGSGHRSTLLTREERRSAAAEKRETRRQLLQARLVNLVAIVTKVLVLHKTQEEKPTEDSKKEEKEKNPPAFTSILTDLFKREGKDPLRPLRCKMEDDYKRRSREEEKEKTLAVVALEPP